MTTHITKPKPINDKLKIILPWVFCALIFTYLFSHIHPVEVLTALKLADNLRLWLYGFIYFVVVLLVDGYALKHFINRFATPVSFNELFIVRGVTYLMMILNYTAAQGILAVYLKKTHKASIPKTLGTLFFMSLADVLLVFTSALLALSYSSVVYQGIDLRSLAFRFVPFLYLGFFLWILFWRNTHSTFVKRAKRYRVVHWILEHDLFLIFRMATAKDYLVLFLMRAPLLFVIIGSFNLSVMAFHSHIDWIWIYLYNPVMMLLTALPLTPGGLGTGQFLTIEFYKNVIQSPLFAQNLSSPQNILFASSLAWGLINQFYKAVFGMLCLTKSSRKFFEST